MIQVTPQMRILVAVEAVDFRKGMDGLARLCRETLRADPFSGVIYVFRNRRRTAVKLLVYDGQGLWLCHKRISEGRFRWWPSSAQHEGIEVEAHELQVLLYAGDPASTRAAPVWRRVGPSRPSSSSILVGWSEAARERNVHLVAYNSRFLIMPWVQVRHLASHLLGRMTRELSAHWVEVYEHPVVLAETYVDRTRFVGTSYRAANWLHVGHTTGRGSHAPTREQTRATKDALVLPLSRDFREVLGGTS